MTAIHDASQSPAATAAGRASGKSASGRLHIGAIVTPHQQPRASIPSKFETILNTGVREKDGFARRTHRFDDPETDIPGPGAYTHQQSLVKDPQRKITSKKGSAAFAATEKRFFEAPRPLFVPPGPGKYETLPPPHKGLPSAAGTSPTKQTRTGPPPEITPGPGEYDVPDVTQARKGFAASAVFKSKTARSSTPTTELGPGEYTDGVMKHVAIAATVAADKERAAHPPSNPMDVVMGRVRHPNFGSAVFLSNTDRDGRPIAKGSANVDPRNLPPIPGLPEPPQRPTNGLPQLEINTAATNAPTQAQQKKPMSIFANTNLDRFGRPTVRYTPQASGVPGPGAYHSNPVNKKQLICSSWAMSTVGRFDEPRTKLKPPGPAYYAPSSPSKAKFHLNARNRWL